MTSGGVTVTGSAVVEVEPDTAVAQLGVQVRGDDVAVALGTAEDALTAMRDALVAGGVGRGDLRTRQTWVRHHTNETGARVVDVELGLEARIRDVSGAGALVHAALAAAGPVAQMNSLDFAASDVADALAQARAGAFEDARAVATAYAEAAGRPLGRVVAVVEGQGGQAPPRLLGADIGMAKMASVPVEPGRDSVSASVTVTWELGD